MKTGAYCGPRRHKKPICLERSPGSRSQPSSCEGHGPWKRTYQDHTFVDCDQNFSNDKNIFIEYAARKKTACAVVVIEINVIFIR